jgi:hypothetical protein
MQCLWHHHLSIDSSTNSENTCPLLCCHVQLMVCPLESRKVAISITYGLLESRKVAIRIYLSVGVTRTSQQLQTWRFGLWLQWDLHRSGFWLAGEPDYTLTWSMKSYQKSLNFRLDSGSSWLDGVNGILMQQEPNLPKQDYWNRRAIASLANTLITVVEPVPMPLLSSMLLLQL